MNNVPAFAQAKNYYRNQWWLVYWRIYASLGLNELKEMASVKVETEK